MAGPARSSPPSGEGGSRPPSPPGREADANPAGHARTERSRAGRGSSNGRVALRDAAADDLGKKARPLLFDSIPDPGIDEGRDRHFLAACKTRERCLDERVGTDIGACRKHRIVQPLRSEEHTSELQSLMRISYAVFCLKKKKNSISKHIQQ